MGKLSTVIREPYPRFISHLSQLGLRLRPSTPLPPSHWLHVIRCIEKGPLVVEKKNSKEGFYRQGKVSKSSLPLSLRNNGFTCLPKHRSGQSELLIKVLSSRAGNRTRVFSGWRAGALTLNFGHYNQDNRGA